MSDRTSPVRDRTAEQLDSLAQRVSRLIPDRRDPHRYHEEKSEIVHQLRLLARNADRKESTP